MAGYPDYRKMKVDSSLCFLQSCVLDGCSFIPMAYQVIFCIFDGFEENWEKGGMLLALS